MAAEPSGRAQWSSSLGFVLAAVGSAVGLGNMWRFSYLAAEHGGAVFVVLYIMLILLVGLPIMLAEFVVGRASKQSPVQAFIRLGGKAWRPVGYLCVISGFLILAYYGVIAGWVVRYTWDGLVTGFAGDAGAHFGRIAEGLDAIFLQVIFMAMTVGIVAAGVRGGIERAAVYLMPVLFAIVAGIAIYVAFLEGAAAGYREYLVPDFGALFNLEVFAAAASQAFFSLSLGMGALLTYASYLSRSDHLPRESMVIAGTDFAVAFVAGLMVFPIIFALGLGAVVGESTVGALFISLPTAFAEMGATGRVIGALFFIALFVGALTSAISLLEVVVSASIDGLGWSRLRAALVGGVAITIIGIPTALDLNWLTIYDSISGKVFLVLGGLLLSLFVGWRMKDPIAEAGRGAPGVRWLGFWRMWLRYVIPLILLLILYYSVPASIADVRGAIQQLRQPTEVVAPPVDPEALPVPLDEVPLPEGAGPPPDEAE